MTNRICSVCGKSQRRKKVFATYTVSSRVTMVICMSCGSRWGFDRDGKIVMRNQP